MGWGSTAKGSGIGQFCVPPRLLSWGCSTGCGRRGCPIPPLFQRLTLEGNEIPTVKKKKAEKMKTKTLKKQLQKRSAAAYYLARHEPGEGRRWGWLDWLPFCVSLPGGAGLQCNTLPGTLALGDTPQGWLCHPLSLHGDAALTTCMQKLSVSRFGAGTLGCCDSTVLLSACCSYLRNPRPSSHSAPR